MKCPYRNFEECIVEQCPSCVYEEVKNRKIEGRFPHNMSTEKALEMGYAWETIKTSYKFLACKLVENSVQPVPTTKQVINNETKTNISIRKRVF